MFKTIIQRFLILTVLLSGLGFFSRGAFGGFFGRLTNLDFLSQSREQIQGQPKKLRDIALEHDVEIEGSSGCDHLNDITFSGLVASSGAIVVGRISDSKSFFEESGAPIERGENITTEYSVEVLGVLKNTTGETMLPPDKSKPLPLTTPLKIARNGGEVTINGHRASVKVKGYERLKATQEYVFFLNWSPDYKAYMLTYCIFGAIIVNDDHSLMSASSSKQFQKELESLNLEKLIAEISRP